MLEFGEEVVTVIFVAACIFWLLSYLPSQFSTICTDGQIRKPTRPRFWLMMFVRVVILTFLVYNLFEPDHEPFERGLYPKADAWKAAALVTTIIIVADALWDILRRCRS